MQRIWQFPVAYAAIFPSDWQARLQTFLRDSVAAQHETLPLWIALGLSTGIGAHFAIAHGAQRLHLVVLAFGFASFCAVLAWRGASFARKVLVVVLAFGAGLMIANTREARVAAPVLAYPQTIGLQAEVLDVAGEKLYLRALAADKPLPKFEQMRVSVRGLNVALRPGDVIQLRARLSPPAGPVSPGGYDFSRVAWFKKIGAVGISYGQPKILRRAVPSSFIGKFDWAREQAAQRFGQQFSGDTGDIAAALVVGERGDISPDITQDLRISGLAHLLSVSGFHLVMVAGGLFWGTRHILALSRRVALYFPVKAIAAIVAIFGSLGYTLLTGSAYPTQRAMIAIAITMFALLIGRSALSLRLWAIVVILLLLVRPEALLDVSFQLSFMGVGALIAFYETAWVKKFLYVDDKTSWRKRFVKSIISTMLATFVAEAALAPIAIAQFHQLGIYGLVANAVAVPFTGFVLMPLGFLSLALQPLGLDGLINPILGKAIEAFLYLARWASDLPHAQVRVAEIGGPAFVVLMLGLLLLIIVRGYIRSLGVIIIVCGIIMAMSADKPMVRIAPEGKIIAALTDTGNLAFPSLRRGRFARKAWLEENAQKDVQLWDDFGTRACTADICAFRLAKMQNEVVYFGDEAAPKQCPKAEILVDMRYDRRLRCRAPIYIDKRFLRKSGAIHIFAKNNRLKLVTAADVQGDHRWAQAYRK
jgi:competence protein ComEC